MTNLYSTSSGSHQVKPSSTQFKILGRANFSGCSLTKEGGGRNSNPLKMEGRRTPKIFGTDLEDS